MYENNTVQLTWVFHSVYKQLLFTRTWLKLYALSDLKLYCAPQLAFMMCIVWRSHWAYNFNHAPNSSLVITLGL